MVERNDHADVLVVGGGGAGLAAALAAAEGGARVLVLERMPTVGGTTGMSIGSVMASASRRQRRVTEADSPESHGADLRNLLAAPEADDPYSSALIDLLVTEAGPTLDWLEERGVGVAGPIEEEGHTHPRMHMLAPTPRAAMQLLAARAAAAGAELRTGVRVEKIVRAGDEWHVVTSFGPDVVARALVLCAGDASAARATPTRPPMNVGNTGDGRTLVADSGGRLIRHVHEAVALRRYAWPHIEIRSPAFDLGMRLEDSSGRQLWPPADNTPRHLVGDYADLVASLANDHYFFVAEGEALARLTLSDEPLCTYPEIGFARWRDLMVAGEVTFTPGPRGVTARIGPFGVFTALTDGGIVVDHGLRVIGEHGEPIEALFAAGAAGWGPLRLRGHGHHLAWALTSGRMAGAAAARAAPA